MSVVFSCVPEVLGSDHCFLAPFSSPLFFHLSWGYNAVVVGCYAVSAVKHLDRSERGNEDRERANKRACKHGDDGVGGLRKRAWLDRQSRIKWHESTVVDGNLFYSVCIITYLYSCDGIRGLPAAVFSRAVSVKQQASTFAWLISTASIGCIVYRSFWRKIKQSLL